MSERATSRRAVLIADHEYAAVLPELAARFGEWELLCPIEGQDVLALAGARVEAVVAQTAPVDARLLDALSKLRVVLKLGRNYEAIDAEAVRARDLVFAASPRKGPNCVAELALSLILALSKDLLISHRSVAEGAYRLRGLRPEPTEQWKMAFHWMRHTRLHEVSGKTLGIVGMGEIGCELARRAAVMGMRIVYHKRRPLSPELERRFAAVYRALPELLAESDYVCLAVPHTADADHALGVGGMRHRQAYRRHRAHDRRRRAGPDQAGLISGQYLPRQCGGRAGAGGGAVGRTAGRRRPRRFRLRAAAGEQPAVPPGQRYLDAARRRRERNQSHPGAG